MAQGYPAPVARPQALVASLVAAALFVGGCGGASPERKVRDTVNRYATATARHDAQTLCRSIFAPVLLANIAKAGVPCEVATGKALRAVSRPTLTISRVQINGNQALADVRTSAQGEAPAAATLKLVKIGEDWRIASLAQPQPQPPQPVGP